MLTIFSLGLKHRREEQTTKKANESDSKQSTPLKYDVRMDSQSSVPQPNAFTHNAEKSGQLLSTSFDSKTVPTQSSPRGGGRNSVPFISSQVPYKPPIEVTPSSSVEENPSSVPPPSVFPAPSPRDNAAVGSPQHPSASTTLTSVSPPSSTPGLLPVSRIPNQMPVGSTPFSGALPSQANTSIPSSASHQNLQQPPSRSFAQTGNQPGKQLGSQIVATSQPSSQPSLSGTVVNHPPSSSPLSQGSTSLTQSLNRTIPSAGVPPLSLPQNVQIPLSLTQGFPNVVATCTTLPSTSTAPLYSQLGTSHSPAESLNSQPVSASNSVRQPGSSMAAAVAAAENAVLQANAQILPSQRIQGQMVQSGQIASGINLPGQSSAGAGQIIGSLPSSVTHSVSAQPSLNLGMSNLVGTSQPSTSVTQTMIPPTQQSVSGVQSNVSAMQHVLSGQQRPFPGVQHVTTQPGVSTGQPVLTPQLGGIPGSQSSHPMQQGTAQSQAPTGLQQNITHGQQPLASRQGHKATLPNPGMPHTQPAHLQQPSQGVQPNIVGVQSTASSMPSTHQMGSQQQQPDAQPIMATGQQGMPPNQQIHPGQPGAFGNQIPQQVYLVPVILIILV